jgi:hypothetical protein
LVWFFLCLIYILLFQEYSIPGFPIFGEIDDPNRSSLHLLDLSHVLRYKHGQMSWNGMFCDRTHSSICQTSIDSNLGVLLRAGTDEKVPDKLVNTIRARKVPNNVTDVSFSNIEVNPRGFRILTRRISTSDIHGWHGYRAWTSLGRCATYLQP